MSALGLDNRNASGGLLPYAPRRPRRADDDSSILPILERLSRGEPVQEQSLPLAPPIAPAAPASRRLPRAVGFVGAAAAFGLAAAAGFAYLAPGLAEHAPAAHPIEAVAPKPVQTVAVREPDKRGDLLLKKDASRLPQAEPLVDPSVQTSALASAAPVTAPPAAPLAAPAPAQPAVAAIEPLQLWSMMPQTLTPAQWTPTGEAAAHETAAPVSPRATEHARVHARPHTHHPHRIVQRHHHVRTARHHHAARHHVAARSAQPAVQAADAQAQPVKKLPLQAAIDHLFGHDSASAPQLAPQPQQ